MTFKHNNKKGFTLIELLVVIAIIGLLSSIILASLNTARAKARDAKRLADLQEVAKALELYYDDHHNYPPTNSCDAWYHTWSGYDSACTDTTKSATPGLVQQSDNNVAPSLQGYIGSFQAPLFDKGANASRTYYYCSLTNICSAVYNLGPGDPSGSHYVLSVYLETPTAAQMSSSLQGIWVGTTYCGQNNFYCIGK